MSFKEGNEVLARAKGPPLEACIYQSKFSFLCHIVLSNRQIKIVRYALQYQFQEAFDIIHTFDQINQRR